MGETPAETLLASIVARDFEGLGRALSAKARLRGLLPDETLLLEGRDEIVERFRRWFGGAEPFEILERNADAVGDRATVRYRLRLRRPAAAIDTIIEQQLVLDDGADGIVGIDLLCSGFRPAESQAAGAVHDYDAGALGCADGLAAAFKKRVKEAGVGDLLRVRTIDPSAKEDLPSLARLMGHTVHNLEAHPDGSLTITVEVRR